MDNLGNILKNNSLGHISAQAPRGVISAIQKASAKTGVDFAYMVQQAAAESSFDPKVKAKTSSATGLYQFIESTWMSMVERYGEKYGIETEGQSRQEILNLRKDAELSSFMAAEFASENERFLDQNWAKGEKEIGSTELYFAHFLGAGQAAAFLNARDENPLQEAGLLFPKAAAANRTVFYDRATGRPKTLDEVYAFFDKKFDVKQSGPAQIEVAEAQVEPTRETYTPAPIKSTIFTANREVDSFGSVFARSEALNPYQALIGNPIDVMLLAQLDLPLHSFENDSKDRKLF